MINSGIVLYFTLSMGWYLILPHTGARIAPETILSSKTILHQSAKQELINNCVIDFKWVGSPTESFWNS